MKEVILEIGHDINVIFKFVYNTDMYFKRVDTVYMYNLQVF